MSTVAPVILSLAPYVLLGLVYLVLARAERSGHLWYWTAAFGAFSVQSLISSLRDLALLPAEALLVGRLCNLFAAYFVLAGIYRLIGRPMPSCNMVSSMQVPT